METELFERDKEDSLSKDGFVEEFKENLKNELTDELKDEKSKSMEFLVVRIIVTQFEI